jgi:hypothetical protein
VRAWRRGTSIADGTDPMRRILRRSSAFVVGGLITLLIACGGGEEDDDQFREDTLTCEEALAHLQECCPNFDPMAVACRYYFSSNEGCATSTENHEEPAFNLQESRCIRNTTCADLVGQGVCPRAQKAVQYIDRTTSSVGSNTSRVHQTHPPVCP